MAKQEISLNEKQLKGLERLGELTSKIPSKKGMWLSRFIDKVSAILSRTTKIWIIILEMIGVIVILIFVGEVQLTLKMIMKATTELDFKKAEMMVNALRDLAPSIATMVGVICGAIPGLVGVLKSLNKKWQNGTDTE